jgi:hypothetical protein
MATTAEVNKLFAAMELDDEELSKYTTTGNGAKALKSTGSSCLDFFSRASSMRGNGAAAAKLFRAAYREDPVISTVLLMHLRDARQGAGERDLFRQLFKHVVDKAPLLAKDLITLIPEYGRWDDVLYATKGTQIYDYALVFYGAQLMRDSDVLVSAMQEGTLSEARISLAGKWAPSKNSSGSKERSQMAVDMMATLKMHVRSASYYRLLTVLRQHLQIVETKLTERNYKSIDYSKLPSRAFKKYAKAFKRNDRERLDAYFEALEKGEAKINTATLAPYELVHEFLKMTTPAKAKLYEAQWKALPDFLQGKHKNAIAVVDTSGSMNSPLHKSKASMKSVAIATGLYLAERSGGPWANHFITFSERPKLQKVQGSCLKDKVQKLSRADWGYNTNFQAVFELILNVALDNFLSQEDMPETVFVISDMEFDVADNNSLSNLEAINRKYAASGYVRPNIVFWNTSPHAKQSPASMHDKGISLVSGVSGNSFDMIMSSEVTPQAIMMQKVQSSRYAPVLRASAAFFGEYTRFQDTDE